MLDYIEYLNIPVKVAIVLIGAFLIMQLVGEILEFKGKVVPEFVKVRKIFTRRKKEREMMQKMEKTLDRVQATMDELNQHYSTDNIQMRDEWIKRVNSKLDQYDASMAELDRKLDKNNSDTLSILVDNKRNAIISFASMVIDETKPVTKEQFNRIFKLYEEYEAIISANGMTNGEVDIAIRIIREAYENHLRNHSFIEDIRGYGVWCIMNRGGA